MVETVGEKLLVKKIISNYHSYVPSSNSVGRRIDFLIYDDEGEIIGVIGIGSGTYPPCKDVLKYLNISKEKYKGIFNNLGNNWRFCLMKHVKNLGTKVLKEFRIQSKLEWRKKYGDDLKYIITYVGGGKTGSVYKADNWTHIGYTAGLPFHKSVSMKWDNNENIKKKFVKPTGTNKKMIFIKKI